MSPRAKGKWGACERPECFPPWHGEPTRGGARSPRRHGLGERRHVAADAITKAILPLEWPVIGDPDGTSRESGGGGAESTSQLA